MFELVTFYMYKMLYMFVILGQGSILPVEINFETLKLLYCNFENLHEKSKSKTHSKRGSYNLKHCLELNF